MAKCVLSSINVPLFFTFQHTNQLYSIISYDIVNIIYCSCFYFYNVLFAYIIIVNEYGYTPSLINNERSVSYTSSYYFVNYYYELNDLCLHLRTLVSYKKIIKIVECFILLYYNVYRTSLPRYCFRIPTTSI